MAARIGFNLGAAGYALLPRKLLKHEEAMIVRAFHEADEDKKGYLSRFDIKVAMVELFGYKPTKYEVNQMMDTYADNFGEDVKGVSLEKFVSCMSEKMGKKDEDEEIRHVFMALDLHCHGFLTVEDVKKVFGKVAPHVPSQIIHSAFKEIDQDGDGRVSYKDFEFLMKYSTSDHI